MVGVNFVINVLIQVLCIFAFLTIFFFTYAKNIEGEVVQNQVNFLLDDLSGIHLGSLPENVKAMFKNQLNNLEINTPENENIGKQIEDSNNKIESMSYKTLAIASAIVIGIVIISFILSKKGVNYFKNLDLSKIFKETFVILIAVGLTEFVFLTYLGSKHVAIDPHLLKAHLLNNIKKSLP